MRVPAPWLKASKRGEQLSSPPGDVLKLICVAGFLGIMLGLGPAGDVGQSQGGGAFQRLPACNEDELPFGMPRQ